VRESTKVGVERRSCEITSALAVSGANRAPNIRVARLATRRIVTRMTFRVSACPSLSHAPC
jgi:hypothetical protein